LPRCPGLYVLLGSPFVAVIQIIIYAGAIMVLFLFVVMLLNVPTEEAPTAREARLIGGTGPRRFGALLSGLLAIELFWAFGELNAGVLPRHRCAGDDRQDDRPAVVSEPRVCVRRPRRC
jgi:hypothetical protein